jgi:hypothetical protein
VWSRSLFRLGVARVGRDPHAGQEDFLLVDIWLEGECRATGQGRDELRGWRLFDLDLSDRLGRLDLDARSGPALALPLDAGVGHELAEQPDGADRVVVGGDDVVELVGVDVGVAGSDDRQL